MTDGSTARRGRRSGRDELWAHEGPDAEDYRMDGKLEGICPNCRQGDLISISMNVSGNDLAFTTCHLCEAKWWYRDGENVPLRSVIGNVLQQRT
jgi:hypothetical protein